MVPIDGKTARGSYIDQGKSNAIHIVSAWATDHGITLGQVAVDSKSNEITAVPKLLDTMELEGTTIPNLQPQSSKRSLAHMMRVWWSQDFGPRQSVRKAMGVSK